MFQFFSSVSARAEMGGVAPYCQTASTPEDGRQSFDDTLETSMWGRVFQRCYLGDCDSSEMLSALVHQS